MPRKLQTDRPTSFHCLIPESYKAWLDMHLWSELEGRVPHGAHRSWFLERLLEYREHRTLDLGPFGAPAGFSVRGHPEVLEVLKKLLMEKQA